MDTRETRSYDTPALEAAGLLLRIGFGLLVLVAPVAAVYSRRAFVVLVPIGSLLIVASALVRDAGGLWQRMRGACAGLGGAVTGLFVVWLLMSLVWTPFPASAAERAARLLGHGLVALAVAGSLPERMRASNLHLMTIGIALATLALTMTALISPFALSALQNPEAPTFGRAAVAASIMVWPAVAWTFIRGRNWQGLALIAVSAVATAASGSLDAATALVAALVVFMAARASHERTGRVMAYLSLVAVLLAPLVAMLCLWVARAMMLEPEHAVSEIGLWAVQFLKEPARMITGHGFDTTYRAQLAKLINSAAPDGLLPMLWYDLGLPGALLFGALLAVSFNRLRQLAQPVAPTGMAVLTGCTVFAFMDATATQAWWQSVCIIAAVMMVAVHNGQYRTARPAASVVGTPSGRQPIRV